MVVYLKLLCSKDFKMRNLNATLEELGEPTLKIVKKKGVTAWTHERYGGRIEFREWKGSPVIDVSIRGSQEDMLTGSFVGWIVRNAREKIIEITVYTSS